MSWSNRCEACPGEPPPEESAVWMLERIGDAAVTWSCDPHLAVVLGRLQRGHEVTRVSVVNMARARAVAAERAAAAVAGVEAFANGEGP